MEVLRRASENPRARICRITDRPGRKARAMNALRWMMTTALLWLVVPVLAQTATPTVMPTATPRPNPPAAACGLPVGGPIYQSATYTLTANCAQTSYLVVTGAFTGGATTLTIEGQGYTIDGSLLTGSQGIILTRLGGRVVIRNATLDGGSAPGIGALDISGSASLADVTFRNSSHTAIRLAGSPGNPSSGDFTNTLIEDVIGTYYSVSIRPAGVEARGLVNATFNNLALRSVIGGNAAIGADRSANIAHPEIANVTITGCFTSERVFPQKFYGNVTDNSSGLCSGAIGNNGVGARQFSPPTTANCGLPASGHLERNAVYNLRGDCRQTGRLWIPGELTVTINGNGHTIDANSLYAFLTSAGNAAIRNAAITGSGSYSLLTYLANPLRIENVHFYSNGGPLAFLDSAATLNKILFEDHSQRSSTVSSALSAYLSARVTVRDSVFRGNTGGVGAVYGGQADSSTVLEGCITFEGNAPRDIHDPNSILTDSSIGPCPEDAVFTYSVAAGNSRKDDSPPPTIIPPASRCESTPKAEALPMGAAACIFRYDAGGDDVLSVWGIDRHSQGYHLLTVTQAQVDAHSGEAVVAVSPDGRALAAVWPDDNVTIKVGPNREGKVLHTTFGAGLHGAVIGTTTTYGPPPGAAYLNPSPPALNCMVTTTDILNFRAAPAGSVIGHIPYNATLTALTQVDGWFKVDYHGQAGWISADYVTKSGDC